MRLRRRAQLRFMGAVVLGISMPVAAAYPDNTMESGVDTGFNVSASALASESSTAASSGFSVPAAALEPVEAPTFESFGGLTLNDAHDYLQQPIILMRLSVTNSAQHEVRVEAVWHDNSRVNLWRQRGRLVPGEQHATEDTWVEQDEFVANTSYTLRHSNSGVCQDEPIEGRFVSVEKTLLDQFMGKMDRYGLSCEYAGATDGGFAIRDVDRWCSPDHAAGAILKPSLTVIDATPNRRVLSADEAREFRNGDYELLTTNQYFPGPLVSDTRTEDGLLHFSWVSVFEESLVDDRGRIQWEDHEQALITDVAACADTGRPAGIYKQVVLEQEVTRTSAAQTTAVPTVRRAFRERGAVGTVEATRYDWNGEEIDGSVLLAPGESGSITVWGRIHGPLPSQFQNCAFSEEQEQICDVSLDAHVAGELQLIPDNGAPLRFRQAHRISLDQVGIQRVPF